MGESSSADPARPGAARRSIRSSYAARVVIPATCLALFWMAALAIALRLALTGRPVSQSHGLLAEYGLLAVAGLAAILAAAMLLDSFGRRISDELSDLAAGAEQLAGPPQPAVPSGDQTPGGPGESASATSAGAAPAGAASAAAAPAAQTAEIARAQAAVASLRQRATTATANEAGLRDGLRQVFVSLAKRNQSLLQRQLRLIDTLEQKASDPASLADLFSLDHLTTRMRRHAESLAILSGAAPGRSWREPVAVIDVIRAAVAEVEDYRRVSVLTTAEDTVVGPAVADMIHLLAELVENATLYSPSGTQVEIRAGRVANGFAIEIDDRGLGIDPGQLREINEQLARPPDFNLVDADRLGLFVGAKLAARHGVRVSLRASPYGGTSAIALLPNSIVAPGSLAESGQVPGAPEASGVPPPGIRPSAVRPARLDLSGAAALAVAARRSAQPPPVPPPPRSAAEQVTAPGGRPGAAVPEGPPGPGLPQRRPRGAASVSPPGAAAQSAPSTAAPAITPGTGTPEGPPGAAAPENLRGTAAPETRPGAAPEGPPGAAAPEGPPGEAEGLPRRTPPATHAGLPRRTRQASLSPHLRDSPPGAGRPPGTGPAPTPPERARDLASSVQSAWRRSRAADPPDEGEAGEPTVEQGQSETPYNEEAR
jgi:signal transduction histidine kinase